MILNVLAYSDMSAFCHRDPAEAAARCTAERSLFMCACVNQTCGMLNRLRQAAEGESAWSKVSVSHRPGRRQGRRTIRWFDILKMWHHLISQIFWALMSEDELQIFWPLDGSFGICVRPPIIFLLKFWIKHLWEATFSCICKLCCIFYLPVGGGRPAPTECHDE